MEVSRTRIGETRIGPVGLRGVLHATGVEDPHVVR